MGVVHVPDAGRLRVAGLAAYTDIPVIFLAKHRYSRELNRYLRERALLDWHPSQLPAEMNELYGRETRYPVPSSLKTMAARLDNFAEWTEWAGVGWREVEYSRDIVGGYQADMLAGRWSANNVALAASTTNSRVSDACNFLKWAAFRGLRPAFRMKLATTTAAPKQARYGPSKFFCSPTVRVGHVRSDPGHLRLPTARETARWSKSVEARFGPVKGLMCRTVLRTGVRREEAVQWRCSYLPDDTGLWNVIGDAVSVRLKYGTKGGKERTIKVPLDHALELHRYQRLRRMKAFAQYVEGGAADHPDRLFLSEGNGGQPISAQVFYEAWTAVSNLPFPGWSVHLGRHYWACVELLKSLQKEASLPTGGEGQMAMAWLHDVGQSIIDLRIRPQLGHCDVRTTERYLQWVSSAYHLKDQYLDFHEFLDAEDE